MKRPLFTAALLCAGCTVPFDDAPRYRPGDASTRALTRPDGADAAVPEGALTLDDCVRIALADNRRIWISDRRVLIAQDRLNEDISEVLPRLTATGRFDWRNNDRGSTIGGAAFTAGDREVATAKVELVVPIYDFGRSSWKMEADTLRIDTARLDAERNRQELAFSVSQAYFRVLEARKIRGVVDESLKVVQRQSEIARDFLGQGLVARSDVLTADVQLAERRQDLVRARNNVELAVATLNRLMGADVNRATEIVDVLEVAPWTGSFESVLLTAVERRPDLAALRKRIEIARADWQAASRDRLPTVFGAVEYNYSTDTILLNQEWVAAGVGVKIPLFDGLSAEFRTARREREIAESVDLHDERVDDILLEVKQAYLLIREAAERIPVARRSIEQAEENLRVIRDQYAEGLLTSAEVLTEEDRLSRARTGYYRSLYEYHTARARLANAIGGTSLER